MTDTDDVLPLREECPTCDTVHTAGSLRYDRNAQLRCPECIDRLAPYCHECDRQWTGDDVMLSLNTCVACGSTTSLLPVRREVSRHES